MNVLTKLSQSKTEKQHNDGKRRQPLTDILKMQALNNNNNNKQHFLTHNSWSAFVFYWVVYVQVSTKEGYT